MRKTIVITGASDGIGAAAAQQLAHNHEVIIVGRNPEKTAAVAQRLDCAFYTADYADAASVEALGEQITTNHPRIDVLCNNAGGIFPDATTTFMVNHLGGFLLTQALMPNRVVNTSSIAAKLFADLDPNNLDSQGKDSQTTYGNAKLLNIIHARELNRRYSAQGMFAVAFHPGVIASNFAHDEPNPFRKFYANPIAKKVMQSPDAAAKRLVYLATGTVGKEVIPGAFYVRNKPAQINVPDLGAQLWEFSEHYLNQ